MKRLVDDPWKKVKDKYAIGQVVEGEVHKVEPFGLMVKLDDEIHGLAHISEVSDGAVADVNQLREMFKVGQKYSFEVVTVEPAEHRLGLKLEGVKGKPKRTKMAAAEEKEKVETKEEQTEEKKEKKSGKKGEKKEKAEAENKK